MKRDCGCEIRRSLPHIKGTEDQVYLVFCQLHEAATYLLTACKAALNDEHVRHCNLNHETRLLLMRAIERAGKQAPIRKPSDHIGATE